MFFLKVALKNPRVVLSFICATCFSFLGLAFIAEAFFNIIPCSLCLYQRYVYWGIAFVALVGAGLNLPRLIFLCVGGFVIEALIAGYQVGIEHHIFSLPSLCKVESVGTTLHDLKSSLWQKPVVPCDRVSWSLFGISMAGYNFLAAFFFSIVCFYASVQRKWKK